jgi:hypothetical protein
MLGVSACRHPLDWLFRCKTTDVNGYLCTAPHFQEVEEGDFLEIVTKAQRVVCHFFHRDFERCKIVDKHLTILARKYFDTRFIKLSAPVSSSRLAFALVMKGDCLSAASVMLENSPSCAEQIVLCFIGDAAGCSFFHTEAAGAGAAMPDLLHWGGCR